MKKILLCFLLLVFTACAGANDGTAEGDAPYSPEAYDVAYEADDYEADEARVLFEVRNDAEAEDYYEDAYEYTTYEATTADETTQPQTTQATATTAAQTTQVPTTTETTAQVAYNYILNVNSLLFHRIDCDTLPLPQNRLYFVHREDAAAAAYRGCNRCNP